MDTTLCLYKEKLKEALTLVPTLSAEKKVEAVTYWNDLAEQLQDIVHKSDSSYGGSSLNQNLPVRREEGSSLYTSSVDCQNSASIDQIHCNPSIITSLSSSPTTDTTLVVTTSTIKQTPIDQYHEENLVGKTIFETTYLGGSPVSRSMLEDGCKDHLPTIIDEKLNSTNLNSLSSSIASTYTIAQPDINCSAQITSIESTPCSSSQSDANIQTSEAYVMKHSNLLTQVSDHQIETNKSIMNLSRNLSSEIYCPSVEEPQVTSNAHVISYINSEAGTNLSSSTNINKLNQSSLSTSASYNNVIVADSLGCPRTTANVTNEIGNGQFDRGPKLFDEVSRFSQFQSGTPTTITLNSSSLGSNSFVSTRNEMFTPSERPLQQIQLFNPNTSSYLGQSYAFVNSRIKYLFCNTCNEQLDISNLDKHQHIHSSCKEVSAGKSQDAKADSSPSPSEIKKGSFGKQASGKVVKNNNLHTCDICGKSGFSTKGNLKRHLRAHSGEKPFKCEYCESCFTEKKSLKIHVRRHTGEKPYKCEICGKLFSQTGVLQSHMALHLNERKFDCQKCGKAFRQRSQLKLHLMRHDGVKRLECSTCMAKFLTKGDLERHCRIHTGERPYACNICSKTFTRQQSLNEHMNRHTGRKPYDCKFCEKTFSEMSACYKHAKTHKRQDQTQRHQTNLGKTAA